MVAISHFCFHSLLTHSATNSATRFSELEQILPNHVGENEWQQNESN